MKRVISITKCYTTVVISTGINSPVFPLQFIVRRCLYLRLYNVDVTMTEELQSLAMKLQWLNRATYRIMMEKLRKTTTLPAQIRTRHLRIRRLCLVCAAHSIVFGLHMQITNLKRNCSILT